LDVAVTRLAGLCSIGRGARLEYRHTTLSLDTGVVKGTCISNEADSGSICAWVLSSGDGRIANVGCARESIVANSGIDFMYALRTVGGGGTIDNVGGAWISIVARNRGINTETGSNVAYRWVAEISAAHYGCESAVSGIAGIRSARISIITNNWNSMASAIGRVTSRGEA